MDRKALRFLLAVLFVTCLSPAENAAAKSIVQWHFKLAPVKAVKPGTKLDVVVSGKIDPGWHLYALEEPEGGPIATVVGLAEGDPADLLGVDQGAPKIVLDRIFQQETPLFEGTADFTLHIQLAKSLEPGEHLLHVLIRYQSCDDHICLSPHTDTIPLSLQVTR